jgi:hypothetical protein
MMSMHNGMETIKPNEHKFMTSSVAYYNVVIYYIIITPHGLVFPKGVCEQNAMM